MSASIRFGNSHAIPILLEAGALAELVDEITGLYAFQLAALRRGDLDSSYQLLRMCPYLLDVTQIQGRLVSSRKEKNGADERGKLSWSSWSCPNDITSSSREERGMKNNRTTGNTSSGGGLLQSGGTLCGGLDFLSLRGG